MADDKNVSFLMYVIWFIACVVNFSHHTRRRFIYSLVVKGQQFSIPIIDLNIDLVTEKTSMNPEQL